jgi:hypothetical protein
MADLVQLKSSPAIERSVAQFFNAVYPGRMMSAAVVQRDAQKLSEYKMIDLAGFVSSPPPYDWNDRELY